MRYHEKTIVMKSHFFRLAVLVLLVMPLHGCMSPQTPQQVAKSFWAAVLDNDTEDAVRYSTLTEPKYYDGFSKKWAGYQPSFGKVTIEKSEASIVSRFASPANSGQDDRSFVTYLVLRDGKWEVDYDRTKQSVQGGALGNLLSTITQLGDDVSKQLEASSDSLKNEMDRMSAELERLSDSSSEQASKIIDKYAAELRKSIEALEESINRALENEDDNLSDHDKRSLQSIADDLEKDRKNLSEPSVEAVSDSTRNIGDAQQQLEDIDNDLLDKYREQWRKLSVQCEEDMRTMLNKLASVSDDNGSD